MPSDLGECKKSCIFANAMGHIVANDILIPEMARLLAEGREVRFMPNGISMRPWIEGGLDSVVLHRLERPARVGDIVLAQCTMCNGAAKYVLHRVLRVEEGGCRIVLMGDGNIAGEEVCTPADILGCVVRIENRRGWRKPLTRGGLWRRLLPYRKQLLWLYHKTIYRIIKYGKL